MAVTLTPRVVGLMVAASLVTGWMGASLSQAPPPEQSARGNTVRPLGGQPAAVPRAESLRQRVVETPTPSRGRNPFIYSARAPRRPSYSDRENIAPVATAPVEMAPLPPPAPIFKLSGIASSAQGGASVLTAIVIDNGAMVFVKPGDKLSLGYTVLTVDEMSVTIADAGGVAQVIRLP